MTISNVNEIMQIMPIDNRCDAVSTKYFPTQENNLKIWDKFSSYFNIKVYFEYLWITAVKLPTHDNIICFKKKNPFIIFVNHENVF